MARRMELGEYCGATLLRRRVHGFLLSENRFRPNHRIDTHLHTFPHFTFVIEGGFTERYEDRELHCEKGSILLVPAGKAHCDLIGSSGAHSFSVELSRKVLQRLQERGFGFDQPRLVRSPGLAARAKRMFGHFHSKDPLAAIALEGMALELLSELARAASEPVDWVADVLAAPDPPAPADLAISLRISEAHLSRRFKAATGQTYTEYLRSKRLEQAALDLADSRMALSLVAAKHGFFDQAHFTRAFRKARGTTPSQYRQLVGTGRGA